MQSRLLEIQNEIDAHLRAILELRTEERMIISTRFRLPGPELEFDAGDRTINWPGGSAKFGGKSWLFLKTLWEGGNKRRATIERIEQVVFGITGKKKKLFLNAKSLKVFLWRLRSDIKKAGFPYSVLTVKNKSEKNSTLQIKGFLLKCNRGYKTL